jgi:probable HAF family extracellular repeat protein
MQRFLFSVAAFLAVVPAPFLAAQSTGKQCVAEHYQLIPLPMRPARINDAGQIAGTTSAHRAALWSEKEGLKQISVPSGFEIAEALGLNRAGNMIGVATTTDANKRRAFIFQNGKLTLLPGEQSKPAAINNNDEIAGESSISGKVATAPVLWKGQTPVDLGACCGGTATGINNQGQVVGQIYDAEGLYQAFLWDKAHGIQRIVPDGDYSSAIAINDAGHVIVQAFPRILLYKDGKLTPLELSPKFRSQPRDFNNCDVIVGSFGPHSDALRAFVWEKTSGFHDLNERIPPGSGWKLEAATGINNRGEIVGWGDYKGNEQSGFLLVPQP